MNQGEKGESVSEVESRQWSQLMLWKYSMNSFVLGFTVKEMLLEWQTVSEIKLPDFVIFYTNL